MQQGQIAFKQNVPLAYRVTQVTVIPTHVIYLLKITHLLYNPLLKFTQNFYTAKPDSLTASLHVSNGN